MRRLRAVPWYQLPSWLMQGFKKRCRLRSQRRGTQSDFKCPGLKCGELQPTRSRLPSISKKGPLGHHCCCTFMRQTKHIDKNIILFKTQLPDIHMGTCLAEPHYGPFSSARVAMYHRLQFPHVPSKKRSKKKGSKRILSRFFLGKQYRNGHVEDGPPWMQ